MELSTFVLGTALAILPLVAAGLLAAMVLLERRSEPLSPAPARGYAGRQARKRACCRRQAGQGRRA